MTPSQYEMLSRQEGKAALPYYDTGGHLTVGKGHNLDEPMDDELIDLIFDYDARKHLRALMHVFPDVSTFGENRMNALLSMMFMLGATRFAGFKKMIVAIRKKDWLTASREAQDSEMYRNLKALGSPRGDEIVSLLR